MQHRRALPIVTLLLGLLASLFAAWLLARADEERRAIRFESVAGRIVGAIESRMLVQLTLLRGTAGFFNGSDEVTREDFRAFVARLRLDQNYPGVLGIGFSAWSQDAAQLGMVTARGRAEQGAEFRAWPDGARPGYSTILYLEPMNRMNRAALGFDMMSEATRRAAMAEARRTGRAQLSGRVQLVQEIDPVKQPGFLIYVPIYEGQNGEAGERLDPDALIGWVYSPLRAYDLFDAIFDEDDLDGAVLEIYDQEIRPDRLLFRTGEIADAPSRETVREIETAGHTWLVRVAPGPQFQSQSPLTASVIAGLAGTLVTLLIAALMLQQTRARARTEQEVALRTAELTAANRSLVAEAEAREAAEAQVRQMQKMEAIGQLTGGIAHDFNNMLAVVIGNLDIVERRLGDPEKMARAVHNARAGAEKAADLTARLLAFGRQQALSPRVLAPNLLVASMSELIRRTIGETIRLEAALGKDVGPVFADPTQLENAILNLAINARDAMPDGGVLKIETTARGPQGQGGSWVTIAVSDTGHGMSPDIAERAIEPFFTTKEVGRGTGLGLSQVYGFVRQSGGAFRLLSSPGAGTTVEIHLPRHDGPDAAGPVDEEAVPEALPRGRGELVLVVEDEEQLRELSAGSLRDLGYRTLEAANGVEALALLERHPDIALLFTDMVMPEMTGGRLAEAARRLRPDLPILFTTGYSPDNAGDAADGAVLQKPFALHQLAARIREELDGRAHA
ncbi:MAG: CHASE domain-containing protein [Allosphingosinicella sp.]|uniref:CHASE domain-containing protein n=1 Tax=Allosphingosinicella sp. TaxID=2823234 RepID=UPI003945A037